MDAITLTPFSSDKALAEAVASLFAKEVLSARLRGGSFSVALSGGRIAQKFFSKVAEQAKAADLSFDPVHFFWADERCVPPDNAESNYRIAKELLFEPLKIAENRIHRIRGELSPESAATQAEAELRSVVAQASRLPGMRDSRAGCATEAAREEGGNGQPVLDLILLGMGEDGHVASLFPGEPQTVMADPAVYRAVRNSPKPPPNRVTLGYSAIMSAKQVWVLASGAGKQAALRESLREGGETPLARVLRIRRGTRVFCDFTI